MGSVRERRKEHRYRKKKGKNKRMKMRERIMHRKNESNINRIKQKGWVMVGIGSEPIRY